MAYTINRRLAELIDSSGQLTAGKLPDAFITTAHYSANSITDAKLHTSFSLPASALTARDTGDLSEGSNLYYTDARARSSISESSTELAYNASTGVLTYTQGNTSGVSEGSNLYYTDARADARIAAADTGDLSEGSNLYYTSARADARIAAADTGDLSEGSNLYYTDARVGTYISGNRTFGNITTTGYIAGPASMVIDPAGVGDNTGTVVIAGNLQVDGTTTTINSTTVSIDDLNFTIASDAADSSAANGAGITIGGASATMLYTHATTSFDFNKPVNVTGNIGVSGTVDGVDIAARDAILTSTTTTAGAALPKAGGTMTGTLVVPAVTVGNSSIGSNSSHLANITINNNGYIGTTYDSTSLNFTTAGDLVATGKLGVGTPVNTAPVAPLHIQFSNDDGGVGGQLIKNTNTGTTSNFASLSTQAVNGTIQGTFGSAHYSTWGNAVVFAGSQSNHPFKILSGNAVRATFDTGGRLAINQDPLGNNFALQVTGLGGGTGDARAVYLKGAGAHTTIGGTGPTLVLQNTNSTANNIVKLSFESASAGETVSINAINTNHSSHYGDMAFNTRGSSGYSEKMRIMANGNVGIGETVPLGKLHIKLQDTGATANAVGNLLVLEGTENGISLLSSTAGAGYILFGDSDDNAHGGILYDHSTGAMRFRTGSTWDQMKILSNGNVGIGTTNPAFKLVVAHNSRNGMEFVPNTDDAGTNIIQNYNRGTAAYTPLRIAGNSLTLLSGTSAQHSTSIDTSGNVSIGGDVLIQKGTATTTVSQLAFKNLFDTAYLRSKYYDPAASTETYLAFHTNKSGASNGTVAEHMRLKGNRLGINQTNPLASLHVYNPDGGNATDKAGMLSEAVMKLQPHVTNSTNMLFAQVDGGSSMGIQVTNGPATANWDLSLSPFGGHVGVGLVAPSSRLHVVSGATRSDGGTVRINRWDNNCGLFLHSDAQSSHYNWMITTQDTVNEGIEFIPSTAVGGTTFSTPAMSIVASTGQMRAKSLLLENTTPISFIANSSENTYMRSVIYTHQNNTGSNFNNGMHIEMGRLADNSTAEIRAFVVGARGGQASFKVTDSAAGVTQSDGDYVVKMHETGADGYVDLFTGEATPVIRTRIASYGTSYFVPTGTTASNQAAVSVGESIGAKAGILNIRSTSGVAGGIRHRMSGGTQYLNMASTHTGAGSIPYWHIKTNAYYSNNVMFVARVHGYAYGNSGHIIDMQRSGYAYSGSSTALVGSQFVNNGSGTVDTLDAYYTSAGQLCFRAYAGASSYYTGWAFDIKMQSPTGYNFDFVVEAHHMNTTSGNYYT